ncbi:cell division protein SepF [Sporolituus thermophilus]|uniref:Cell division inhibitor SepF n=1 Tax=Sporolituus thermophilus DSM 23256 TaxID=1123285 RepID=A0A1G7M9Y3_9FIRM|nr:cell division protein SepF [Sporolituus thermophilus]SDF58563.1 cell division inhibitor SepF [Sporolituus thermophilus DSM 23256]
MAQGLIERLTNFLMPIEEVPQNEPTSAVERRAHLRLHKPANLKIIAATPQTFDDIRFYADYLQANYAVIINMEKVDAKIRQRITDFLNGVSYVTGSTAERVSDEIILYVPPFVEVGKELYAYTIPTYVKRPFEGKQ